MVFAIHPVMPFQLPRMYPYWIQTGVWHCIEFNPNPLVMIMEEIWSGTLVNTEHTKSDNDAYTDPVLKVSNMFESYHISTFGARPQQ